jgi:hypothetical protein
MDCKHMKKLLKAGFVPLLLIMSLGITMLAANAAGITSSVKDSKSVTKKEYAQATTYRVAKLRANITLYSVGDKYVNAPITFKGDISANKNRVKKRLYLQQWNGRHWVTKRSKVQTRLGTYKFYNVKVAKAGKIKFRTLVKRSGRLLDKSNTIAVKVIRRASTPATCASSPSPTTCPKPANLTQLRTVEGTPDCSTLTVPVDNQRRIVTHVWSTAIKKWVPQAGAWTTVSSTTRPATTAECVVTGPEVPAGAVLPDVVPKSLVKCGAGDKTRTGGDCFLAEQVGARTLLKFPVITLNVGEGTSEITADRTSADADDWTGYQAFYGAAGDYLGSVEKPGVEFYFAQDGHNHWHIRDFDYYQLYNTDGSPVMVNGQEIGAEKHGYCLQDNTSYGPMEGMPGVSPVPVYDLETSCGYWTADMGEPDDTRGLTALSIVHGLSRGWGDTYPSTLPDQAIDITGVPPGEYVVQVHVDDKGAVTESDDANNIAQVHVVIGAAAGGSDGIQVLTGTACGGVDDAACS